MQGAMRTRLITKLFRMDPTVNNWPSYFLIAATIMTIATSPSYTRKNLASGSPPCDSSHGGNTQKRAWNVFSRRFGGGTNAAGEPDRNQEVV